MMRWPSSPAISSRTISRLGSLTAMTSAVVDLLEGHEVVAKHQLDGDGAQQLVLDLEVLEVDELGVVTVGEGLGLGALVAGVGRGRGCGHGHYVDSVIRATSYIRPPARAKRWAGRARSR